MRVDLLVEGGPIGDRAVECADVDEVKVVWGKIPFLCAVVDFELAIGRDPGWLDRREVGANHVSSWELVGEVDRPDTGASANVKDVLRAGADGGLEEFVTEK